MHQLSISIRCCQVTYSYLARKVQGILDMVFLIIFKNQGLTVQGLGNPGYGFSSQRVGRAWRFHTLLSFPLSTPPHYCPFILQDNFVAMKLQNFWFLCFYVIAYKTFIFLVFVCSFRVVNFLVYVYSSRASKVLLMRVALELPIS